MYVCSMHFKARSFVYLFIYLQVVGAYFENTGSKSFAVYAIAVTDAENKTWFVKRRQVLLVNLYGFSYVLFHNYIVSMVVVM